MYFLRLSYDLGSKRKGKKKQFWQLIWPSRIPDSSTKQESVFCLYSLVSCNTRCSAALPIVHFNCTPHKEQKYPLGTHMQSHTHTHTHTYKLTQFLLLICTTNHSSSSDSLPPPCRATQAHSRGAIFKSPCICIGNRTKIFFRPKQKCFLAGISNSNVSNEMEEKRDDWKKSVN